jgi:hypothetical protein
MPALAIAIPAVTYGRTVATIINPFALQETQSPPLAVLP